MGLFSFFTKEIAIDLGTANTVILHNNQVVVDEPSIIAIDTKTKSVKAVGKKALMMEGRTPPGIITTRPLRDGVIADFQGTEMMLREFIKMTGSKGYFFPPALKMVICIPSGITEVEERAVRDSTEQAGARDVRLIYEPMAAAIGIGLDVLEPEGNIVVDIGGGTSEIAVISLGGIVQQTSIKTAGDEFTQDIVDYVRQKHGMSIGSRTAELVKMHVGAAMVDIPNPPEPYEVHGRDLMDGIPKAIKVTHQEIAEALDNSISQVETAVLNALEKTPAELSADIYNSGIYLAGGGSLLRGLDKRLHLKTKLEIHIAEDPLRAVARGTAVALKNFDRFPFLIK